MKRPIDTGRRRFLAGAALTAAATMSRYLEAQARPDAIPRVGLQLFTIPKMLDKDLEGSLRTVAQIGYRELELYGPYPFSADEAWQRWRSLTPDLGFAGSGYFGLDARRFRELLDRHGLSVPSMHVDLVTLETRLDRLIDAASQTGTQYAGLSAIPDERRRTLDDYRRMADVFNELGSRMAQAGMRLLYHNHGYGLKPVDGKIPLRVLIERTDPRYVVLELDMYWTAAGGADPKAMLDDYPGRYRLIHLKDMRQAVRFEGDGGDAAQWMKLFSYMTNAGQGVLDVGAVVGHARRAGVEHYIVEYDRAPDPEAALRASFSYLSSL